MDNQTLINQALRGPHTSADPSLGSLALALASWNTFKDIVRK